MPNSAVPLRLIIPAYNEGRNIEALLDRLDAALKPLGRPWRAFIVDDGSRDDTAAALARLAARLPVTPLSHGRNRGIAAVFLTGMRAALEGAADDDAVAIIEGDGTSDPALIPRMLEALAPPCDVVIASRYVAGGAYRRFPLHRIVYSVAANALLRWICAVPGVTDYSNFYRLYRAGPLKAALAADGDDFTSVGGFACNAEIILRLVPWIGTVREVPFIYDYGLKKGPSGMRIAANLGSYVKLFGVNRLVARRALPR